VIKAKWVRYPQSDAMRDAYVTGDSTASSEWARAWCGRDCGDWVAHRRYESYQRKVENPGIFRLSRGFVQRTANDLKYPFWELPKRAQRQRDRALKAGKPLRHWEPTARRRLGEEEHYRAVFGAQERLVDVIGVHDTTRGGYEAYVVDPQATGGRVVVCCPNCERLNEVPPCPSPQDLGPAVT
jgi:hypothetical protein